MSVERLYACIPSFQSFGILVLIGLAAGFCFQFWRYTKTIYYAQTGILYPFMLWDKGRLGEYRSYKFLRKLSGHKQFLFNLYLPKDDGGTSEIDVVMLHETGIYVLESKNYSGWIFGTETHKTWTQTLPQGKGRTQKEHFYNPILQNKSHVKWLKAYLKDDGLPIFSCIVFSERCDLKEIHLTSGEHAVIKRDALLPTVKRIAARNGRQLSDDQIDTLYRQLYPLTQASDAEKLAHIQAIQRKTDSISSADDRRCPRCGGKLILRTAAKGPSQGDQFYGCCNYPKCRYTEKVSF